MNKIRLMVVDDNKGIVDVICEYFKNNNDISVDFVAYDGMQGIELIESKKDLYDVILLDIIMPKKDGMYVLEEMKNRGIDKKVIVETSYDSSEIIKEISNYGASYFIAKPYDLSDLEKRIINVCSREKKSKTIDFYNNNVQVAITKMLHELGIPSHIKGYQYIRDGINILFERPELIGGITKELYPELAKKYDTTVSRVERAMRHAIEVGWTRSNWKLTEDIFGQSVDYDRTKPTNSEFVVTLADKLRLDFHKVNS